MTLIQREKIEQIRAKADRIVYEYPLSVFTKMLAEVGGEYIEYTVYRDGHMATAELKGAEQ